MSQYIITIVPVVDDDLSGPVSQTVVRIDTAGGRAAVRELTMRAPEGADPLSAEIFEMLLRAFGPQSGEGPRLTTPAPQPRSTGTLARATKAAKAGKPDTTEEPTPQKPAKKPRKTAAKRAGQGARRSGIRDGRAYRKAPGAEALEAAYAETGTINGVAEHFGVPVHTAQGWISRLRRKAAAG
jgi:hypothetical protein